MSGARFGEVSSLRNRDAGERGILSGMRMVDDAASSRGTGGRGGRLSPFGSSRSALVAAGIS